MSIGEGTLVADRFEIDRKAGSGGMGAVYRARDRHTGGWVALKLLHDHEKIEDRERFVREASLLAELKHPGIVGYVAHGDVLGSGPFLAMEWLDGEHLGERLSRGPLRLEESVVLIRRIAEALAVAHRRSVVHRDLKPSNLFLRDGRIEGAMLLDFGIARRTFTMAALTRVGALVGTPIYMAPEQVAGHRDIGPALDIFALGCVLYECITGKPPFMADQLVALLARILMDEPTPILALRPQTPAPLCALLSRMLAKDPALRPRDAAALLDDLDALGPIVVDDPRVTATHAQSSSKLTDSELSLCCVLIAAPRGSEPPSPEAARGLDVEQRAALRSALLTLGARAEWVLDGSLLATLSHLGSATDLASQAARCALLIKERWPEAEVVLATGRGIVDRVLPAGEAIDGAAQLLRERSGSSINAGGAASGAARSGVWVDELSANLLGGRFALGTVEGAAVLIGEVSADETRPLLGKPTPCVGREQEIGMLEALLATCVEEADAKAILVTAPPGIGKSRLRHEFLRRLAARGPEVTLILGHGEMMSASSPYAILGQALRRLGGVNSDGATEADRARLHERLGQRIAERERPRVSEFLGELCNVASKAEESARLRAARRDPKIMNEQIKHAFIDFLRAECGERPVLLVFEDLQWGDAPTAQLLDAALRELHDRPLMVLALARPEVHDAFPGLWEGRGLQKLSLSRLSKKASERLVRQALGGALPEALASRIVDQAAGNALYLEELIREVAAGRGESPPKTVLAMLQARISRLEAGARRALRAASVFGQVFWQGGVIALLGHGRSPAEVERWLDVLIQAEVVEALRESRFPGERELGFRHALMREAAYELLTDDDRTAGHQMAARYLVDAGAADPMVIVEHFERGNDAQGAIPHYVRATRQRFEFLDIPGMRNCIERAVKAGVSGEALGVLRSLQGRADYFGSMPDAGLPPLREAMTLLRTGSVDWCRAMGAVLSITSQIGEMALFAEAVQQFAAATPDEDARAFYVSSAMSLVMMFALIGMRAEAERFLDLGRHVNARIEPRDSVAYAALCHAEFFCLRYLGNDPWMEVQMARQAALAYGQSGLLREVVMTEQALAVSQVDVGAPSEAEATARRVLALAEQVNETMITYVAANGQAYVLLAGEDPDRLEAAVAMARKTQASAGGNLMFIGLAGELLARALFARGDLEEAETEARKAIECLTSLPVLRLQVLAILIRVLLARGSHSEARRFGEEGLQGLEALGGGGLAAIPIRLAAAEARAATGDMDGARSSLRLALSQIEMRAEKIPDADARESYLTRGPASRRARSLAGAWLGDEVTGGSV